MSLILILRPPQAAQPHDPEVIVAVTMAPGTVVRIESQAVTELTALKPPKKEHAKTIRPMTGWELD